MQLSDARHGGITEKLVDLYKQCGEVQQPSDQELQIVLRDILGRFSQVYIIIDALDECTDRKKSLNWVKGLIREKTLSRMERILKINRLAANLHIVVTSRPERDIHEVFAELDQQLESVDVGEANTKDIEGYLTLQMELKFTKYDGDTRAKIMSEMKMHVEGSYVYLVLSSVQLWLIHL